MLADDQRLLREALSQLLETGCDVVGTAADGRALLTVAAELRPDIVVLDAALPLLNGLDAARRLRCVLPGVKVIVLTAGTPPASPRRSFARGVRLPPQKLGRLRTAPGHPGGLSGALVRHAAGHAGNARHAPPRPEAPKKAGELSPRRREVLQLLAEGRTMKETARILKITPRTVAFHKYGMMEEHGIKSNAELMHFAVRRRVVSGY